MARPDKIRSHSAISIAGYVSIIHVCHSQKEAGTPRLSQVAGMNDRLTYQPTWR